MSNILSYLFESNAIKFCKENEPFWLTSGKLSPYFFNIKYAWFYRIQNSNVEIVIFGDSIKVFNFYSAVILTC